MDSPSEAERRRAQNRENLRAHYGLAKGSSPLSPLSENGKRLGASLNLAPEVKESNNADALDPDSPAFSPQQYYRHLVTTSSLPQLMKTTVKLSNDAKNLNSSRYDLVYNHHHQLFAAGDTIAQLNAKTPQLRSIVASLQESFDEISTLVANVEMPADPRLRDKDGAAGNQKATTPGTAIAD